MTEPNQGGRLVLLTIIGLPLTMILTATWLWYFVVRGDLDLVGMLGTANNGTLVQPPRQLYRAGLREAGGADFVPASERPRGEGGGEPPRWMLLVPLAGPSCDAVCEHTLYLTRQIHLAMGKELNRIGRYLVADSDLGEVTLEVTQLSDQRPAPPSFSAYLGVEQRGLIALELPPDQHRALFSEYHADPTTWYLVDPAGWVMMSYNDAIHYKDVIADLKFLLKNSGG